MPSRLRSRRSLLLLLIALAVLASSPACRRENPGEGDATSVRIQWLDQAQFAGLYVANAKGYFKAQKLNVSIEPGGPDVSPVLLVASGSNDFGVSPATDIIQARSNGVPVVAIATIFQKNPVVFFAQQSKNIKTPKDFVGHTVGLKYGMEIEYYYRVMMKSAGVDASQVKEVPIKVDMPRFFSGEVDVWSGYSLNEPLAAEERNIPVREIFWGDWGVPAVGDTMFTTERLIRDNPNKVAAFLRAVMQGWSYAIQHPDEAVAETLKVSANLDHDHQTRMFKATVDLIQASHEPLGSFDIQKWNAMYKMMLESGLLKTPVDIGKTYNNSFIENINAAKP
jgi:ABC-type nitrate/sulfonate/bicarbonate transport system substrate-binding protein